MKMICREKIVQSRAFNYQKSFAFAFCAKI